MKVIFKKDYEITSGCFIKKGEYSLHRNYNPTCIFGTNKMIPNIRFWGLWINDEDFICITLEKYKGNDTWFRDCYKCNPNIEVSKEGTNEI
jgi:hypothetical protein